MLPDDIKLTEEEQELLTSILNEIVDTGSSDTLEEMNSIDYDEIPVDIYTFMTDKEYLGNSLLNENGELVVYPYWVEYLKKLFDTKSTYQEAAMSGSIGLGKSTIATIGMAYVLYKLLCLKDPSNYYELVSGSNIALAILNLDLNQAYGVGYDKLQNLLKSSPWFLRNGKLVGREYPTYYPDKGIEILVGSKMSHFIGRDIFCMTGDTIIVTNQGELPMSELENKLFRVYQYDENKNKLAMSNKTTCIHTDTVTEVYEIELEDGTILKCSPDHKLLTNKGYKKVIELTDEDELIDISGNII